MTEIRIMQLLIDEIVAQRNNAEERLAEAIKVRDIRTIQEQTCRRDTLTNLLRYKSELLSAR